MFDEKLLNYLLKFTILYGNRGTYLNCIEFYNFTILKSKAEIHNEKRFFRSLLF